MIHLDNEQKRILKAFAGSSLGFIFGYPLLMWAFGKIDTCSDLLAWVGVGLIVGIVMGVFFVIGSKIPKK